MENGTDTDSMTSTKTRGRPAVKNVDEQIAALAERMALLRKQKNEQQKKNTAKLVQVIGAVIMTAVNDNDDPELTERITRHLRERVSRPVERELVETWLASQTG